MGMEIRLPSLPELSTLEELKRKEYERIRKAREVAIAVIDDLLEELGLGHPVTAVSEFIEDFSPYSILTRKLGIPAPGDVLDAIRLYIKALWTRIPPLIPKPPGVPEIRKLVE